jgi:glycosyltransferase involved in cell wall biosynthesis
MSEKEASGCVDVGRVDQAAVLPFVSVVMPVRNEAAFIERSVGSVLAQDYPLDRIEILIADGLSQDATRQILRGLQQQHSNIKIVDNPGKIVATGLNAALGQAKGEIIVRVDGHCEIAPDYLSRCVEHLLNDQVEAVGGPLKTIGESYIARVIAAAMSSRFGVGGSAFRVANSNTQFTDTVAFPAYTRAVIDRAGPFDEELVRNQDDEYNYRLRKLGVKILLAFDVRSRYYSRATLTRLWSQYFQYGYWKVRVMQKHPRQMQLRQLAPPLFVAALFIGLALAMIFPLAGYLLGVIAGSYSVALITASILSVRKNGWALLPILPIAFAILHLAYGSGFLIGLLKFWNRWREGKSRLQPRAAIRDGRV